MKTHIHTLIGTNIQVATAWEPVNDHSTEQTFEEGRMGRVGTRRYGSAADSLPTEERYTTVKAWYASEFERAYEAILAEHPEFANGVRRDGEIVMEVA